ncbi:non-ribosomal peptide synthetase, partial [Listeria monocytogenes]|uniref:non-ribosomal peptide synthetase n=2 Tax=Listeria monocytogenes TaxID=1639 RepID=UPI000E72F410
MTNIKAIFPLTGLQKGMLYHSLKNPCGTEYVTQQVFKLSTIPNKKHLLKAIKIVNKKFDMLRSTILITPETNKEIAVIYKDKEPAYKESVITEYSGISDILSKDLRKGFDLQKDALIRYELIKTNNDYYLLISFHHIILDGWSAAIVYQDLIYFYNQLNQGKDEQQLVLELQKDDGESYQEFIQWLNGQDEQQGLNHWKELLDDYNNIAGIKATKSPIDKPHHQKIDRISRSCTVELNNKLEKQLKNLGVTHSTLMEMAWGLLLQNYSGSKDVVFGKVVSGREAPVSGIEQMVGLFINTVPVRVKGNSCSLAELLISLQKQNTSSLSYSGNSLIDIQEYCGFNVDLVNTIVVFENYYVKNKTNEEKKDGELHWQIVNGREETNYGLTLSSYLGEGDRLGFDITYQTAKYEKVEVERMLEQLELILTQFSSEPLMKVKDLKRVTSKEGLIISTINQTIVDYPSNESVITIFESIAAKYPQKEAVALGDESWSYSELNRRSNQIAQRLLENGIQHGEAVGILANRSLSMIAGLIGIVKTGAIYVPIDPKLPENRINYLIKDAKIQIVLTTDNRYSISQSIPTLVLDESLLSTQWKYDPINLSKPEDLIYAIYTSGTTGTPKGVQVTHQNVLSLAYVKSGIELTDESRLLQTGSLAFDASTYEIWGTLLNGGTLILPEEDLLLEPEKFKKLIDDKCVNILFQTTRLFNQIVEESPSVFDNVDRIIFGGEKAQESIVSAFYIHNNKTQLFNAYGPTETTTYASIYKINREAGKITLGHPISNKTIYIEQDGQLCGIGMPGEILIGGDGVSAGYLNNPELTAEKFIENPYGDGRVYRSGDLGRYLPDGSIEYMGRMDEQVKIRGYRIELGEIEQALLQLEGVKQVAVIERKTEQDHALYAYLVGETGLDIPQLRRLLRSQLPEYMIPGKMLQLESLPMTRNGKLDKKALPEIDSQGSDYVPPKNEVERSLQRMYEEILELTRVSVT